MAKKSARIKVGLECSVCGSSNYVTERNKVNTTASLVIAKYCKQCKKRTEHKERKKLH